jgi:hypothetical protein
VHAELHGAASCVVRSPSNKPSELDIIPPATLEQAGQFTVSPRPPRFTLSLATPALPSLWQSHSAEGVGPVSRPASRCDFVTPAAAQVCLSSAWNANMINNAWWVHASQVRACVPERAAVPCSEAAVPCSDAAVPFYVQRAVVPELVDVM